jgi:thiamine monophosphate synthase
MMNPATRGTQASPPTPPSGVWAIASGLSAEDLNPWMDGAAAADAWTFRLPATSDEGAHQMLKQMRSRASWLAVHAEWNWAKYCQADAFVAGSRSAPITELPATTMQLGVAAHDDDELRAAHAAAAHFAFYSPIWDTPSKRGILAPRGTESLGHVCRQYLREQPRLPIIALGGIETPEQVAQCKQRGAHAVAVLRAAQDHALFSEMIAAWRAT